MCGRFTQSLEKETLERILRCDLPPLFQRRYNIAPSQQIALIRQNKPTHAEISTWGWPTRPNERALINARIETAAEKPTFKTAFLHQRGLIPADGFYEWKQRQPYYFQLKSQSPFAFAALWRWKSDHRTECLILTRAASHDIQPIHHRMPVILERNHWDAWLSKHSLPKHPPELHHYPTSPKVNRASHDEPDCIAPVPQQIDLTLFPELE